MADSGGRAGGLLSAAAAAAAAASAAATAAAFCSPQQACSGSAEGTAEEAIQGAGVCDSGAPDLYHEGDLETPQLEGGSEALREPLRHCQGRQCEYAQCQVCLAIL